MVKCEICGREYEDYISLGKHIRKIHKISSKDYYDKYVLKGVKPVCEICGAEIKRFYSIRRGYTRACSKKCGYRLMKKTNLKKYGVESTLLSKEVKEKIKQTNLRKYGTECVIQSKEIREKVKQTNLKKYVVENAFASEKIKEKIKQTNLKRYGVKFTLQSDEIRKKIEQTNLKKYGVKSILQVEKVRNMIKQTNIKKYGSENPLSSEEIKNKVKKTNLEKYGTENITQRNIINFDKWNDVEFNKKNFLDDKNYLLVFKMMDFFNVAHSSCYTHMKDLGIDYSLQQGTSHYEREIFEFLQFLDIKNIIRNDRKLICPKELDFYLPDYKLAIEFDGIFWHSEQQGKTKRYHLEKTNACEEKGVQLIHIFETEWVNKKEIVKSILKAKLHKLKQLCYARHCKIREITVKESSPFLNKNHRQGAGLSSVKLGAYFKDELVAVMTFSKPSIAKGRKDCGSVTNFEISRFAPKMGYHIPGIASKLFSFFKKNYDWEKVLTFADRRYSSKALYDKIGFKLVGVTEPCYWYFKQESITLKHRFKYRKSELKKLLKTFDPKLTEYQNMVRNNFDRVWDVGNLKFEYVR